jgi:hypothetical protein
MLTRTPSTSEQCRHELWACYACCIAHQTDSLLSAVVAECCVIRTRRQHVMWCRANASLIATPLIRSWKACCRAVLRIMHSHCMHTPAASCAISHASLVSVVVRRMQFRRLSNDISSGCSSCSSSQAEQPGTPAIAIAAGPSERGVGAHRQLAGTSHVVRPNRKRPPGALTPDVGMRCESRSETTSTM